MKISIVTISFNQAKYLERTIVSVLNQNCTDIEYIIVDPGSTDGSREIIERYQDHFAHIIFEEDRGPADGLNKGFALATGDWFGYINSDDYYLPGGLARVEAGASKWPYFGALVGDGYIVDTNDEKIRHSFSKRVSVNAFRYKCAFALQQATFYRASVFREIRGFKTDNRTCWDSEILADMLSAGYRVKNLDADIGAFRIHDTSITGSGRLVSAYQDDIRRIREKMLGRPASRLDQHIIGPVYRYVNYIRHPLRTKSLVADWINRKMNRGK